MKTIATLLLSTLPVLAAPLRVSWEPNVPGVGVHYRVVRITPDRWNLLGETDGTQLTVDASPGDRISVIAFNELGDSDPSEPIQIPTDETPPPPMVKVRVWRSDDLGTWREVATLYVDRKDKGFFKVTVDP